MGGDRIDLVTHDAADLGAATSLLREHLRGEPVVDLAARRVSAAVDDPVTALADIAYALRDARIPVEDIALRRPTLDEVFLHLTGASTETIAEEAHA
nr:hypothetical protein [Nocardia crassostreae]